MREAFDRKHALAARALALFGLAGCGIAFALAPHEQLTDPLTLALMGCALCAAIASVDFEDTVFIDASVVPLLLAAIFLGPAPALLVVLVAEAGAWSRLRYRSSAALINLLATGAPTLFAAWIFLHLEPSSGTGFYLAVASVSVAALVLNFSFLTLLLSLLDRRPLRAGIAPLLRVFPAAALNVVLVIAAANVYVNVGLGAVVFVLVAVFAFTYLIAQVFAAREHAANVAQLAASRQHLAAQVVSAEDRERRRLASVLHDGPIQALLTAGQDLHEALDTKVPPSARVESILRGAVEELRSVVIELYPAVLDRRGIGVALEAVARDQAQRAGLVVHTDIDTDTAPCSDGLLYSVARELIINVAKHAQAKNLWIRLTTGPCGTEVEVEDDGIGLAEDRRRDALAKGHIGLASIEDRVDAVGGTFTLKAGRSGGTSCCVVLPYSRELADPFNGQDSATRHTATMRPESATPKNSAAG